MICLFVCLSGFLFQDKKWRNALSTLLKLIFSNYIQTTTITNRLYIYIYTYRVIEYADSEYDTKKLSYVYICCLTFTCD